MDKHDTSLLNQKFHAKRDYLSSQFRSDLLYPIHRFNRPPADIKKEYENKKDFLYIDSDTRHLRYSPKRGMSLKSFIEKTLNSGWDKCTSCVRAEAGAACEHLVPATTDDYPSDVGAPVPAPVPAPEGGGRTAKKTCRNRRSSNDGRVWSERPRMTKKNWMLNSGCDPVYHIERVITEEELREVILPRSEPSTFLTTILMNILKVVSVLNIRGLSWDCYDFRKEILLCKLTAEGLLEDEHTSFGMYKLLHRIEDIVTDEGTLCNVSCFRDSIDKRWNISDSCYLFDVGPLLDKVLKSRQCRHGLVNDVLSSPEIEWDILSPFAKPPSLLPRKADRLVWETAQQLYSARYKCRAVADVDMLDALLGEWHRGKYATAIPMCMSRVDANSLIYSLLGDDFDVDEFFNPLENDLSAIPLEEEVKTLKICDDSIDNENLMI